MKPNILLIVMDSVSARNTSLHGHVNETTPFLSDFAAERATTYTQARSSGARSITGHASLFTGLQVEEHGVSSADQRLKPGSTIFETLQDEGYSTAVFSENVWITDVDIGLNRGFDHVVGPQDVPFPDALNARRFVAEEGQGRYRRFLTEALDDDETLRSLATGSSRRSDTTTHGSSPIGSTPAPPAISTGTVSWTGSTTDRGLGRPAST